jgi:hypothetical protein
VIKYLNSKLPEEKKIILREFFFDGRDASKIDNLDDKDARYHDIFYLRSSKELSLKKPPDCIEKVD